MPLTFDQYQLKALSTAVYPDKGHNIIYPTLGLNGEAGEVAEIIKKVIRDKGAIITKADTAKLRLELGDTLWYVAAICDELGLSLADVAQGNLDKLSDRQQRGVIGGSGDDR